MPEVVEVTVIDDPITIEVEIDDFAALSYTQYVTLLSWFYGENYRFSTKVWDTNNILTSGTIVWPDGNAGTYTTLVKNYLWQLVDSYEVTYRDAVLRQPTITRDDRGNDTIIPTPVFTGDIDFEPPTTPLAVPSEMFFLTVADFRAATITASVVGLLEDAYGTPGWFFLNINELRADDGVDVIYDVTGTRFTRWK